MTTINDPLVGTTYDRRYRIERRIGAGGMANVYLAQDETLGRQVAIKVLHQRYAEDAQFVERFLREASAAARLNHPNIVQVYDRGQSDNTYYIAMEYVDGMTLKELVQRRGGLTEQEVLAYGRQALHALRFAHRNGIVHRDVKPHNMMVDTDGRLKIADFGIARAGADSGLTEAGSIVGTAQYLSPEQAQGHDVSATSDLYSLGVVMYEMATGRVPFDGDSPVNVALQHVKDEVPRPSTVNPGISPQLESIVLHAMEKDRTKRYVTADEMLADLDRARAGSDTQAMTQVISPMGATAVTPITPAPIPVGSRRYDQPVPIADEWDDADSADDAAAAAKQRKRRILWISLAVLAAVLAVGAWWLFGRAEAVAVPDVVGKTRTAAEAQIRDAGFVVGDVTTEFSADEQAGIVLEQDPSGTADEGSEIDLVVSRGPETDDVPDVRGTARGEAIQTLTDAGFEVREGDRVNSDTVKPGFVVSQSPAGGAQAEPGDVVTIVLSDGPDATAVPNVVGMTVDAATTRLEDAGFSVRTTDVDSSEAAGTVVDQDPVQGSKLEEGERVTLQVASGSNTVPDVRGQSSDAAQGALSERGFSASVQTETTSDPAEAGIVLGQEPGGNQRVEIGSTIVIRVGEVVEPVEEPAPEEGVEEEPLPEGAPTQ